MDSELPHCTVCLKSLPAGWLCKEHKDMETETETMIIHRHCMKVTGKEIIELLNQEYKARGVSYRVPDNAEVIFHVPGGADWSHTDFDIDASTPVTLRWETQEHE